MTTEEKRKYSKHFSAKEVASYRKGKRNEFLRIVHLNPNCNFKDKKAK